MVVEKFMPASKVVAYIEQEQREALSKRGIKRFDLYAWTDEAGALDKKGIAVWQWEPPCEDGVCRCASSKRARKLQLLGDDFYGLMRLAYAALGQTLVLKEIADKDLFSSAEPFWSQQIGAFLMLDVASERLRDFFVYAYFDQTSDEYKKRTDAEVKALKPTKPSHYQGPFLHASRTPRAGLEHELLALNTMSEHAYAYHNERNTIVHDYALKSVRFQKEAQSKEASRRPKSDWLTPGQHQKAVDQAVASYQGELSSAMDDAVDWYSLLVKMGDAAFVVEHGLRENCPGCSFSGV